MIILCIECGVSDMPELVLIDGERERGGEAHLSWWSIVETTNGWHNSHFLKKKNYKKTDVPVYLLAI